MQCLPIITAGMVSNLAENIQFKYLSGIKRVII